MVVPSYRRKGQVPRPRGRKLEGSKDSRNFWDSEVDHSHTKNTLATKRLRETKSLVVVLRWEQRSFLLSNGTRKVQSLSFPMQLRNYHFFKMRDRVSGDNGTEHALEEREKIGSIVEIREWPAWLHFFAVWRIGPPEALVASAQIVKKC